jgi:hypothetical protein
MNGGRTVDAWAERISPPVRQAESLFKKSAFLEKRRNFGR